MKFYVGQHKYYCGIDLHTNKMYLCVLDREGRICLHKNLKTSPAGFLLAIEPFREDVVVAVECIFTWYWIADLCEQENIPFVLGHALYMKAIHGGKAKNDKYRFPQDRGAVERWNAAPGICLSRQNESDP